MIDKDLILSTDASDSIPESIRDLVNSGRIFLGVDPAWHIYLKMNEKPLGSDQNAGCAHSRPTYMNAHLEFAPCVEEETKKIRNEYVWHELMHVSMSEVDAVVDENSGLSAKEKEKTPLNPNTMKQENDLYSGLSGAFSIIQKSYWILQIFQEKSDPQE